MRKIILLIISEIIVGNLFGQTWEWSNHLSCAGEVTPAGMVVDQTDNVYLVGNYRDATLTIQGDTIHNFGDRDGFVCKFSSSGDLIWLKRIGGTDRDLALSIQLVGNSIYVLGEFRSGTLYFTSTDFISNTDNFDSFLASYDLNGNFLSAARIFYGNHIDRAKGMIYDANLNSFVFIGQFQNELKYFDGISEITVPVKGPSGKDYFIIRTNLAGHVQDTTFIQSTNSGTFLKSINFSTTEGYYIGGDAYASVYFNPSTEIISQGNADIFIAKYDTDLDLSWVRQGGGLGYDHVNSAGTDQYGNIYVTGKVESTVTFDSTATLTSSTIEGFGLQDLYLLKYNKQGRLLWVKRKGSIGNDNGYGLTQRENLVQFCGNISDTVIFNTDTLTSSSETDVNTGFAIFSTNGVEIGAQGIGGLGTDIGEVISFNNSGSTIISGYFNSTSITIGDSVFSNTSGTYNGFIASFIYPMNASFTDIADIQCNGDNNGSLIVTPYFGVERYTYNWSPNVLSSIDSLAYNLTAGTYSVTVTDSRDSTAFTSIVLNEPTPITIAAIVSDVSCHPWNGTTNDGAIDLSVSGGTVSGPYDYSWLALSGSGVTTLSEDQTTLTKGQYIVTVADDNLCEAYDTFLIDQPDSMTFGLSTVQKELVPPGNNGEIDLEVSGGTPGFLYDWDGPGSFDSSDEDIINLGGGTYLVLVTDANSCEADTTFLVINDDMLIAYISGKTNIDCKGNSSGSATVEVSGGTGPYTYLWKNNLGTVVGSDNKTLSGVPADIYHVKVTDLSDGDTSKVSVTITEPAYALNTAIAGTDLLCYNDFSGVADLAVSGGTLPYAFHWNNGATTEDLVDLPAADYSVTVTDNNECIAYDEVEINQPTAMDINITIDQLILCNGDLTGILTANTTGGTGTKSYIWDDPGSQTDATATGLEAGTYSVTATDLNGCSVSDNVQLLEPAVLSLSETHQNVSCFGGLDGIINLSVSGGTIEYNYEWSSGQVVQDLSNLGADTYSVTVTDAHNCTAFLSVELTEPEAIIFQEIGLTDATCFDYSDGTISITAQGGAGNYQYSIDGGSSYSSNTAFADIPAGIYTLRILDDNGCESTDSIVTVNEPEGTTLVSTEITDITCFGYSDGSITITATSPVGSLTYSIDEGVTYLDNSGLFTDLSSGSYIMWIRDGNGCEQQFPAVDVVQPDIISIDTNVTQAEGAQLGEIEIMASGGTLPYAYHILGAIIDSSNSSGIFFNLIPDDYLVHATDENTCTSDTLVVTILQTNTGLTIYDAFSPNDDGMNEVWNIPNINMYPHCKIAIFNTWGNKVFSSDGYPEPWNGTYNGKDLPAGTYYFIIDLNDGSDPLSGPVSIVR